LDTIGCGEEHDRTIKEAKFAFRCPELDSTTWRWTLVIHFPRERKTYLFQTREENGLLQAYRAEIHQNTEFFEKSTYFDTAETSPRELLEKAKQVETGEFNVLANTKTWLKEFLDGISPKLSINLSRKFRKVEEKQIVDKKKQELKESGVLALKAFLAGSIIGLIILNRGGQ
jgi:hypothetical protein